jgi:hypothetical protein
MSDAMRAAQHDLAFMREIAEDRGPLPPILGAHLLAAGLPFGLNLIYTWAGLAGLLPWPQQRGEWVIWSWAPAVIAYIPMLIFAFYRSRGVVLGPAARTFAAAWTAVMVMTFAVVGVLVVASMRSGTGFYAVWPSLAFTIYGGAWTMMGVVRRKVVELCIAAGCFLTALGCAALTGSNDQWLALGAGLLIFLAAPGAAMMRTSRPAAA